VISDLGKEVRHPFLDEDLIKFINTVPLNFISDYRLARGIGDKKILRMVSGKQVFFYDQNLRGSLRHSVC
jgi:hypothetical protein